MAVLFSGHMESPVGGNSRGALSATGIPEYVYNDAVLAALPESIGTVDLIRIPATANVPIAQRTNSALQMDALFMIEVHHDSAQPSDIAAFNAADLPREAWRAASGFCLFVRPGLSATDSALNLARSISRSFLEAGWMTNSYHARPILGEGRGWVDAPAGIYEASFRVLRDRSVPVVLVECGVITNPLEEPRLSSENGHRAVARALADGIAAFVESR